VKVFCKAGDTCSTVATSTCGTAAGGSYTAYASAGGALCGYDSSNVKVYCKPGGTCSNMTTNTCQ
jgi:hypothetical protein